MSNSDVNILFSHALNFRENKIDLKYQGRTAAFLFFEASTRTRMSFEAAAVQLGLHPLILSGKTSSSLEKGETLEDTILNIASMSPSVLIIRSGEALNLNLVNKILNIPILNAGWGCHGHPTQALLDIYTLSQKMNTLKGVKILIVGDVLHSRVAASHQELSKILGYELAWCGPESFMPKDTENKKFNSLEEGLAWGDVVMCLRLQAERHSEVYQFENYRKDFGLTKNRLSNLKSEQWILHPGPINHGVELDSIVLNDSRSLVLEQVSYGVSLRQALLDITQNPNFFELREGGSK
jgi:aspartate carbamoyltransferase catalytic subunit